MSQTNSRWGAPRIHGELLKLGFAVSQATVAKYMVHHRHPPSQTWRTFLANHVGQIVAADFFVVPTATGRLLFVLVILAHARRRIRQVAVTEHPTATWTSQQLREAFPWDQAPRYVVRDRDHAFDARANTAKAMEIDEVLTVMLLYCAYYEKSRTHLSLNKDAPIPRPVTAPDDGRVVAIPQVGGLQKPFTIPEFDEMDFLAGTRRGKSLLSRLVGGIRRSQDLCRPAAISGALEAISRLTVATRRSRIRLRSPRP